MWKARCVFLLIIGIFVFSLNVLADEVEEKEKPVQLDYLGGGIYRTSGGKMVQAEDLGEGDYMTQGGKIIQTEDLGGDDYLTTGGKILQVEDESKE